MLHANAVFNGNWLQSPASRPGSETCLHHQAPTNGFNALLYVPRFCTDHLLCEKMIEGCAMKHSLGEQQRLTCKSTGAGHNCHSSQNRKIFLLQMQCSLATDSGHQHHGLEVGLASISKCQHPVAAPSRAQNLHHFFCESIVRLGQQT
jgi:hypothetical protein